MANQENTVGLVHTILKYTYGLLFVIAGADKFMNLVTNWGQYVNPMISSLFMPILPPGKFILAVGIIEIIIGLTTLFFSTRMGAFLTAGWFGLIVLNLLSMGTFFDIAVRDLVLAIGAICLGLLSQD